MSGMELSDYGYFQLLLADYAQTNRQVSALLDRQKVIVSALKAKYPKLTQDQREQVESQLEEECLDLVFKP